MAETQNNVAVLHKKEWQTMTPVPTATVAGAIMIADQQGLSDYSLYMATNAIHYLYSHSQDSNLQITSGAFAVALAAGVCGTYHPWSVTYTASGGSTTTITVAAASFNINGSVVGKTVRFLSGTAANIGLERTITAILNDAGAGTITLTLDSAVTAVANNDTFKVSSGSFIVLNAGTLAATNYHKRFDIGTQAWSNLAVTGLPASWGTDGAMVTPALYGVSYDSGTAAGTSTTTTLDCTGKTWATDQWKNYQVRITGGTACGQVRVITANDADTLTFASGTAPDATSTFVIEGDEDAVYIMGNNAVTLYKYSISGNTTATVSVTAARAAAPGVGMGASFIGVTGDSGWASTSAIKDGRYLYCLRGSGGSVIDRYDIPTLAWLATTGVTYPSIITYTTGASQCVSGQYVYIAKEGNTTVPQRFYRFDVVGNKLEAIAEDWYFGGANVLGQKLWIKNLSSTGTIKWLYCLQSTAQVVRRIMLF